MPTPTILELHKFNDWANHRVLDAMRTLSPAQIEQPFEMGRGSLSATMKHLFEAERIWLDRIGGDVAALALDNENSINAIERALFAGANARKSWLESQSGNSASRQIDYKNLKGESCSNRLSHILLHIYNHAIHHRAQAVNMIRRLGGEVPKPGADYIFMKIAENPPIEPDLDLQTLRDYYAYGDWAFQRVIDLAEGLPDVKLDQSFEMGAGSLRKTLDHISLAEAWWFRNWTEGPGNLFPDENAGISVESIRRRFNDVAAKRDAMLGSTNDSGLSRRVEATPRPNVRRIFPIGVTMLQLCCHGTHHRAQAANMLRHLGVQPPVLDLVVKFR